MSLVEFGCPNLEYVYEMTWAEFRIRQFAYNRVQRNEWIKVREVAYYSYISGWMGKDRPPTKEQFMPLNESDNKGVSESMFERIKAAQDQYNKDKDA